MSDETVEREGRGERETEREGPTCVRSRPETETCKASMRKNYDERECVCGERGQHGERDRPEPGDMSDEFPLSSPD